MDNPNLLNYLILTRTPLPLFSSLLPSLSSPILLSSSPSSIIPSLYLLPYISLSLTPSLSLPFFHFLSSSLLLSSSLHLYIPFPLILHPLVFFPSFISPFFFSPCYKHSLSILCSGFPLTPKRTFLRP